MNDLGGEFDIGFEPKGYILDPTLVKRSQVNNRLIRTLNPVRIPVHRVPHRGVLPILVPPHIEL